MTERDEKNGKEPGNLKSMKDRIRDLETDLTDFRDLMDSMRDPVLVLDADLRVVSANRAYSSTFELKLKEVEGRLLVELGGGQWDIPELLGMLNEILEKDTTFDAFEVDREFEKIGRRIMLLNARRIHRGPGKPHRIVLVIEDVTVSHMMKNAMEESEAFQRALLENVTDTVFLTDDSGRIVHVGGNVQEIFKKSAEEIQGLGNIEALLGKDLFNPEEISRKEEIANIEREITDVSGQKRTLLISVKRVALRQGTVFYTCRDITERKQAEEEREKLQSQLLQAQKLESVGRLAGGVAHDFNNILSVILGYGEAILDTLREGDPLRRDMAEIVRAGERAAALTRQLLAFSRKQILQPEVLDLNKVIRDLEKMLHRLIGEDIELKLALSDRIGRVMADPGQMEQVIMNLAVNARDAMPGGGKLMIETADVELDETYARTHAGVTPGKYVMLAVTDNGSGMDRETLSRIFEPFFSTKEKEKGTGLGLSTVYGIVKQSGGNIWAYSEPGRGTTFKIYLPETEAEPKGKAVAAKKETTKGAGEKILVVEDDENLRNLMGTMLSRLGYKVTLAANGGEALLLMEKKGLKPDLVITDVVMPNMSGKELAERLLEMQPDLKVLYMSGYTDNAIAHHGVLDPGIPFIQKPFILDDIAEKVRAVLQGN
ncbi:MAG: PAS domain S-box protein [Deltaproteobacteria bacterium]|nr:PAS domain S-box protein [Deltaproteobacteria bacterium]